MIPFAMAVHAKTHKRAVMVVSAQSGKSETLLDIMGERLDTSPVPMIYAGPSRQFLVEQWAPRMEDLMQNTCLVDRCAPKSRQKVTRKLINGVPVRLAHGRSSTALKSDPFGLALTDEADEMMAQLNGQGNPIGLIDARGDSYADFVHAITSTPSLGSTDVERDPESGLEFWADSDPEEIQSVIWRLWLTGTKYHWAWPCPHCGEFFIPRFQCLGWDKPVDEHGREMPSSASLAKRTAHLVCTNGCVIKENDPVTVTNSNYLAKEWMNEHGVYVAPGQKILPGGIVDGLPPESTTISFWVSGLCSPFVSWGERASRYVEAVRSGDPNAIQSVKNQGFGELYSPGGGAVPEWGEVMDRALPDYRMREVPEGVRLLTLTADVQKDRIYYTVRGWGAFGTSWLIDADQLYGPTEELDVWNDLAQVVTGTYDGLPIRLALVDSGFRPGKKFLVPEHRVYAFARRFPNLVRATKGSSTTMRKPIVSSKIDVKIDGKEFKQGLELLRLDTDYFKSWVQQRVRWLDDQPGAWHLPEDITEDYCRQIVSEARTRAPGGKVKWVQKARDNHYLDCEAMQGAAQMILNLGKLRDGPARRRAPEPEPQQQQQSTPPPAKRKPGGGWMQGSGSIWG
ncbi:phage terminase large subunit GpA-like protein [Peteryoungia aggregata LMG 23059]|uniref:Phage terminase large subunit GpA-like protein n=2 Tax=Peteryoungia aggregata TaxID=34013 RepID=A0ABU0GAC1_9HYPH|nr:phage terminase large subunit GpA-like protein [Peteryoungia aggregata LMG 23059]